MSKRRPRNLCSLCGGRNCQCKPTRYRSSAASRGYGHKWRVASLAFLSEPENRICRICEKVLAQCVDHIKPHLGNDELFWDVDNWQPACIACNTRKAQTEERTEKRTAERTR